MKSQLLTSIFCFGIGALASYLITTSIEASQSGHSKSAHGPSSVSKMTGGHHQSGSQKADGIRRSIDSVESAMKLPSYAGRIQALVNLFRGMEIAELEMEYDRLPKHVGNPFRERPPTRDILLLVWGEKDPQGALTFIRERKIRYAGRLQHEIIEDWAALDPHGAAEYSLASDDIDAGSVAEAWAQTDIPSALDWVISLRTTHPEKANAAMRDLVKVVTRKDPAVASTMLEHLPDGDAKKELEKGIARCWAKRDRESAKDWVLNLPQDRQGELMNAVVNEIAGKDRALACTLLDLIPEGKHRIASAQYIAGDWAVDDWDGAEQWIQSLPEECQKPVMFFALENLAHNDPEAASTKLDLAQPDKREALSEAIAETWCWDDPEASARWLIQSECSDKTKSRVLSRWAIGQWARKDPKGVFEFIQSLPQGYIRDRAVSAYEIEKKLSSPGRQRNFPDFDQ